MEQGYIRYWSGSEYIRVVVDRRKAYKYLSTHWSHLPIEFFKWLREAKIGNAFKLRSGIANPEHWIMAVNWKGK